MPKPLKRSVLKPIIRQIKDEYGLEQQQIAEALRLSKSMMSFIISGYRKPPIDFPQRIAKSYPDFYNTHAEEIERATLIARGEIIFDLSELDAVDRLTVIKFASALNANTLTSIQKREISRILKGADES